MNIIVLSPVRSFGDGLADCFNRRPPLSATAVSDLGHLRQKLAAAPTQVVVIDVTQGLEYFDVRSISAEWPDVPLVALGLNEQRQEVISCGRTGFAGYVPRNASLDALCTSLTNIMNGRLECPPEISSSLFRALFRHDLPFPQEPAEANLTRREGEVLELLGRGLSNKEIGSELCLSVATVKHHVHNVLEKLKLRKRAQAMRRFQDAPWMTRR